MIGQGYWALPVYPPGNWAVLPGIGERCTFLHEHA